MMITTRNKKRTVANSMSRYNNNNNNNIIIIITTTMTMASNSNEMKYSDTSGYRETRRLASWVEGNSTIRYAGAPRAFV